MEIKVELPTPNPGIVSPLPTIPDPKTKIPTIPEIPDLTEITDLLKDPEMADMTLVLNIAGVEIKLAAPTG